jgi:hypothetical protein
MRVVLLALAAIISVGIGLGTAYQSYLFLWHPERTLGFNQVTQFQKMTRYAVIYATMFGVGYMIYKGVEGMLWWLPRSWVQIDEDGEAQWIGHSVAGLAAFGGSLLITTKLEEVATELVRFRQDRR